MNNTEWIILKQQLNKMTRPHDFNKKIGGLKMTRNPQVNCETNDCYYNVDGLCKRAGIHANRKSCFCYVRVNAHVTQNEN